MNKKLKHITIVCPCYNEEDNVVALFHAVQDVFKKLPQYTYEHLFIDNDSKDKTPVLLVALAQEHPHVKVILNSRNFGHIRSPYYGLLQASGDAALIMASDFQDPPEMISQFLEKWEAGFPIVVGVKNESQESALMFLIRKSYYKLVYSLADVKLVNNFTGFGLYDQKILEILRTIEDPYPYFRGLIAEIGFDVATIPFTQPRRTRGITKNNFYTLYDIAMLGITTHSKIPLRFATMAGFILSMLSFLCALGYFIAKLLLWNSFTLGTAPIIISVFFFASVQLFSLESLVNTLGSFTHKC